MTEKMKSAAPKPDRTAYVNQSHAEARMGTANTTYSPGSFVGWEFGTSSRPQHDDECISPTDNSVPVFSSKIVTPPALDSTCSQTTIPPQTRSASLRDRAIHLRDSAGPSSLDLGDLDFRPTSKCKGKASIRNASFQSGQSVQLGDEQTSPKERYASVSIQSEIPNRATVRDGCPPGSGSWNNGKSLSETFAYYADAPCQNGFWSLLVQWKSRRSRDEPPEPASNDKHARAALCEKVIRNGGAHTATHTRHPAARSRAEHDQHCGEDDRPFRIIDINASPAIAQSKAPTHPQQQCQQPHQHSRVARCEMPVKSCLNCTAVASCSGTFDHDGHENLGALSCTTEDRSYVEKRSSRWKAIQRGLRKVFL